MKISLSPPFLTLLPILPSSIDAKLGKKSTLLDLSLRPSVASVEPQGAASSSTEEKDGAPSATSCRPPADSRLFEGMMEGDKMKTEELSVEEKMEVDPADSGPDEGKGSMDFHLTFVFYDCFSFRYGT